MNQAIIAAIREKRLLRLVYEGGYRTVEPHAYGHNAKTGSDLLRAYQISGSSRSFAFVGWKLFRQDEIRLVEVLNDRFASARPEYKRGDKSMDRIYVEL
jgi:hypothetical protein